jgi:glycosyltransferase involved in cell wall biosynthesis
VPRDPDTLVLGLSALADPGDPTKASRWPASLLEALREVVDDVFAFSDTPPGRLGDLVVAAGALRGLRRSDLRSLRSASGRIREVAHAGYAPAHVRELVVRHRTSRIGQLDGLIQHGADFSATGGLAMVTYQDSTLLQAARAYPWPHLRALRRGQIEALAHRQRRSFESASACCAATAWVAESIVADYSIPRENVHVVGCGANYAPAAASSARDWQKPRFLFIGSDWERKNGAAVLRSFAHVREHFPNATLDVVGAHPSLDLAGVTGHGRLAIDRDEQRFRLTSLYERSTAFVMPSLHEPAGSVHVEAARAGIASIGSANGGAETCIGDGGFVVDPESPAEITAAMLALCDPELARELGERARQRAQMLTWRKVAERIVRAFGFPGVDTAGLAEDL